MSSHWESQQSLFFGSTPAKNSSRSAGTANTSRPIPAGPGTKANSTALGPLAYGSLSLVNLNGGRPAMQRGSSQTTNSQGSHAGQSNGIRPPPSFPGRQFSKNDGPADELTLLKAEVREGRKELSEVKEELHNIKAQLSNANTQPNSEVTPLAPIGVDGLAKLLAELVVKHGGLESAEPLEDGELTNLTHLAGADLTSLTIKMVMATVVELAEDHNNREVQTAEKLQGLDRVVKDLQTKFEQLQTGIKQPGREQRNYTEDEAYKPVLRAMVALKEEVVQHRKLEAKKAMLDKRDRTLMTDKLDGLGQILSDLERKTTGYRDRSNDLHKQLNAEKGDLCDWTSRFINAVIQGPTQLTADTMHHYGKNFEAMDRRVHGWPDYGDGEKQRLVKNATALHKMRDFAQDTLKDIKKIENTRLPGLAQPMRFSEVPQVAGVKRLRNGSEEPGSDDGFPFAMSRKRAC